MLPAAPSPPAAPDRAGGVRKQTARVPYTFPARQSRKKAVTAPA